MGRHSVAAPAKSSSRRRILVIAAATVVVALVGGGVYVWVGGLLAPKGAVASGCDVDGSLVVVADTSVAAVATEVADAFDAANDGCTEVEVRAQDAADTAALLAGDGLDADVWLPDSSVWLDRVSALSQSLGRPAPDVASSGSIATSPVVFAAPASRVEEIAAEPVTWTRVVTGTLPAIMPDPDTSAASLAGLLALRSHSSPDDPRQFAGAMIALGKTIPASTGAALSTLPSAAAASVVITSEALIAAHNLENQAEPLTAAYPTDGTVALDYPYVAIKPTVERSGILSDFRESLLAATDAFSAAGFRTADGTGELDLTGLAVTPPAGAVALDGAAQVEILRQWGVLTLRSRILAVIDVSGSMEEPTESGLRRIDIFQQAAGGAMSKFSGEVQMGVWIFSTERNGTQDWEDLSPIAPLGDQAHTAEIAGIIDSLPSRLGGATALYDTTLAAVQRVRESYDPEKINSVLLITDGKNEDENGIDLNTLLAELAKIDDPAKPVPVIMIGFGPDTDMASMQQIAKATGGAAYSASKPEDLGIVLVDALSQRSCRPNCG
ncbi:VWA domain-containing protein [Agromyces sp. MMS24-JH15]|uniref:VWA domain-containing protein n=1 Tax=Agromyces sp. MMS24-JH15 TaxID=3243765 RepID=UPI003748BED5